ncbi:hypothetical protein [Desulfosporosinus youngiae]|nr:hypothetical protein [Desulfosporosinus youngiae]
MKNWRGEILNHFSEPTPALKIVSDPDELLCNENIYRDALAKASLCL